MTIKQNPCVECGATGRDPHSASCSIGIARSAAAKKGFATRQAANANASGNSITLASRRRPRRTTTVVDNPVQTTRVALVVDRSGSMRHLSASAVQAVNDQLDALKAESVRTGQPTYVSLYLFGSQIETIWNNEYVHSVGQFSPSQYRIEGMTAMMDCIGTAVDNFDRVPDASDPNTSFLLITITDGMENASRQYTHRTFTRMMQDRVATDRWTFVFNGPSGAKRQLENLFGAIAGNIQEWEQTSAGTQRMSSATTTGIASYMTSRSLGERSTKTFFTLDMSAVNDSDIRNLDDLSGNFHRFPVNNAASGGREWQIGNFVTDRLARNSTASRAVGLTYSAGIAYYQLTKTEKVQASKDMLVRDKTTGAIYGGPQARALLGVQAGCEVRLKVGNLGNYDVFILSTSHNRNLVRGTDLLVRLR